jgi:hypothetical protein
MSCEEILLCNDIGSTSVGLLMAGKPNHEFYSSLLPGKCLQAGFRALFNEGGSADNTDDLIQDDVIRGEAMNGSMYKEDAEDDDMQEAMEKHVEEEDDVMQEAMEKEDNEKSLSNCDATIDFLGIAREKRERSAAKADDAAVPEYLWLEHLFDDAPWEWDSGTKDQIIKMINWFRSTMLRRWKRNVFLSFEQSLRQQHPQLLTALETSVDFRKGTPSFYIRSSKGLGGQTYYRHWWLRRWSVAGRELTLGGDVIARASRASWWAWEDGSRPIHWR